MGVRHLLAGLVEGQAMGDQEALRASKAAKLLGLSSSEDHADVVAVKGTSPEDNCKFMQGDRRSSALNHGFSMLFSFYVLFRERIGVKVWRTACHRSEEA